jgi:hypothetical protein
MANATNNQKPETVSIRVRKAAHEQMTRISGNHRMGIIDVADVLVAGWRMLTVKQRAEAITIKPEIDTNAD